MDSERDPRLNRRASHEDREGVIEHLRRAAGEGRLDIDELGERVERALAAKTYADLHSLLVDLPGQQLPAAGAQSPASYTTAIGGTPTSNRTRTILSDRRRDGAWVLPGRYIVTAVLGKVLLDLREASFAEPEATISCSVVLAEVKIRVGPDVTVVNQMSTALAESKLRSSRRLPPVPYGGPLLRITGTAILGTVTVERLAIGERWPHRWRRGEIQP